MICLNNSPALNDGSCGTGSERPREPLICLHCKEVIREFEQRRPLNGGREWMHLQCLIRNIMGSVGHQKGECSCYGKVDTSEDGLSLRDAARLAYAYWREHPPHVT